MPTAATRRDDGPNRHHRGRVDGAWIGPGLCQWLENADLVGTDLTLDIHQKVLPHLYHRPGPSPMLEALVAEGKLGFKSGQGFRHWTEDQKAELRGRMQAHLVVLNLLLGG